MDLKEVYHSNKNTIIITYSINNSIGLIKSVIGGNFNL